MVQWLRVLLGEAAEEGPPKGLHPARRDEVEDPLGRVLEVLDDPGYLEWRREQPHVVPPPRSRECVGPHRLRVESVERDVRGNNMSNGRGEQIERERTRELRHLGHSQREKVPLRGHLGTTEGIGTTVIERGDAHDLQPNRELMETKKKLSHTSIENQRHRTAATREIRLDSCIISLHLYSGIHENG
jgi:hypothetical protein